MLSKPFRSIQLPSQFDKCSSHKIIMISILAHFNLSHIELKSLFFTKPQQLLSLLISAFVIHNLKIFFSQN